MALASKSMQMSRANLASKARRARVASRGPVRVCATAASDSDMGFKTMRNGVKVAGDETLLTPRFYTT